ISKRETDPCDRSGVRGGNASLRGPHGLADVGTAAREPEGVLPDYVPGEARYRIRDGGSDLGLRLFHPPLGRTAPGPTAHSRLEGAVPPARDRRVRRDRGADVPLRSQGVALSPGRNSFSRPRRRGRMGAALDAGAAVARGRGTLA